MSSCKNDVLLDDAFFRQLESQFPGGPQSPWFVYAILILQANDHMDLIGSTWEYVKSETPDEDELLVKARKMREALLKASVLVGFPKVIPIMLSWLVDQC